MPTAGMQPIRVLELWMIDMRCVVKTQSFEETIKKSRFMAVLMPCNTETQAMEALRDLSVRHPQASHIVFTYRLNTAQGIVYRFHDAGEPSGTAGKPIYQHLEGKQLIDVLLVVIRYFGGIKLGAGGLVRAYGGCAKQVIEAAQLVEYVDYQTLKLTVAYHRLQALEYQLKQLDGEIVGQSFGAQVDVEVRLPAARVEALKCFAGSS